MSDKVEIKDLPDPEDYLADMGENALFGLYMRVYWQYMELAQKNTDALAEQGFKQLDQYRTLNDIIQQTESAWEQWLARAVEQLPEWASDILAEIDQALEDASNG